MKRKVMALWLVMILCFVTACSGTTASTAATTEAVTAADETTTAEAGETETETETVAVGESKPTNLYFVRHGKTILNTLVRVQGWCDSPLTEAGVSVAKDTAYGLADTTFDYVYSSDRMRCIETADIIMSYNHASEPTAVITMAGLRETNFGKYEGEDDAVMWGEVLEVHGMASMEEFFATYVEDGAAVAIDTIAANDETGEAEDHEEVVTRLMASVEEIAKEVSSRGGGNVLIVGHGAAIGTILGEMGSPVPGGGVANASVSIVEYKDGNYDVQSIGDMSYAEQGAKIRAEESEEVVIYLTRHGKTVFNTMDRVQGWIDSPLTEAGREVAENLGKGLADIEFSAVYTSDMGRTIETAELVLGKNETSKDLPIYQRKGMRETYYGKYEGGFNSDMLAVAMEYYEKDSMEELLHMDNAIAQVIDVLHETDETGMAENYTQMSDRVVTAFKEVAEEAAQNGGGNVLIVSHGNAIMAIVNSIADSNVSDISNAAVTKITYKAGEFTVESVNDKSYFEKGAAMLNTQSQS